MERSFTISQASFVQMERTEINRFVGAVRRFIDDCTLSVGKGSRITRDEITVVSHGTEDDPAFHAVNAFTLGYMIALGFDADGVRTRV